MERTQKKRLCLIGVSLVVVGSSSFSNYPILGAILSGVGAVLIITKEVMWRRSQSA